MQLTLAVQTTDGDYTVSTNLGVIIAWERKFKRKVSQLGEGIGMEDLAFMAFECCKQNGIVVSPVFDDYIKTLVSIDVLDDEDPKVS
jgi:hypothetical protein